MTTTPKISPEIKCPHCGIPFSPEAALEKDVRLHLEKEFEKRLEERSRLIEQKTKKVEEDKFLEKIKALETDRQEKSIRLHELEKRSVIMEERELLLKEREEKAELEMRRKMLNLEKAITEKVEEKAARKAALELQEKQAELDRRKESFDLHLKQTVLEETEKAREQEKMRSAELQKKLDDQTRLVNEMKRKSEQGSMQSQGEIQERVIEDFLIQTFPRDHVEEIAKGKRGGDCIHNVMDGYGNSCGKILYESKRTKAFSADWTTKLKEDMRLEQADVGVIVTEVLPLHMTRFGQYDGVWICSFAEFKALSLLFRDSLIRVGEVKAAQENKGDKMQMLYSYLTSTEFRQKVEAIVEAFQQMQLDLTKEKAQTMSRWSRTEKQIFKVMENTVSLYGDVRGIAGNAVKEIAALEVEQVKELMETN